MKQSHCEMILEFFRQHDNKCTLGELLEAGYGAWAHSLTRRFSDLRAKGYTIEYVKADKPSHNLYVLTDHRQIEIVKDPYRFDGSIGEFSF